MSYAGAEWLEKDWPKVQLSPLGRDVANLLGDLYGGLYHLPGNWNKVKWQDEEMIELCLYDRLATYDFGGLTRLVVLCHDRCIRCEISAAAPKNLRFRFSRRQREGLITQRHPTIEEAIEQIRQDTARSEVRET